MTTTHLRFCLIVGTTGLIALAASIPLLLSAAAEAQPYPSSPLPGQRLVGRHITVYLQTTGANGGSRTRQSMGADPIVLINDVPISVAGTVSGYSSEGNTRWIILSRRDSGDAWIPMDSILMIEQSPERERR